MTQSNQTNQGQISSDIDLLKNLDVNKVIQQSMPKLEDAVHQGMANERAGREPLPSIVEEAFSKEPLTVTISTGEVIIRPMVAYDINIFKLINSPFYKIMMGDITEDNSTALFTTEEESYELIYQFTHSPLEIYKLFKQSKEAFKDKVMEDIAFVYNPQDAAKLVSAIMEHIFHVNLARVQFNAPETKEVNSENVTVEGADELKKK